MRGSRAIIMVSCVFVLKGARKRLLKEREREYSNVYIRPMLEEARRLGIPVSEIIEMIKKEEQND
jgi:GntR family transcriptional regulator